MKILQKLVGFITPDECLACGEEGRLVCHSCATVSVINKRSTCYSCNRLSDGWRTCASCRRGSTLKGVVVASHYDGVVKELIGAIKFGSLKDGAEVAVEWLVPLLDAKSYDLVTSVPTSAVRYRQRGYNQSEVIARQVARKLRLPYLSVLVRLGSTRQVGAARQQRMTQLKQSFALGRATAVKGRRILLIDDVLTTGATMTECAKVLTLGGAKGVWGAVVAKH